MAFGQIEPLSRAKDGRWSGQDFVDALREVLPDLDSVLAKRQALLRRLYRRALSRKTIRLQAPKPGRNEQCPCGSRQKVQKLLRCLALKSSPRDANPVDDEP